MTDSESEAVVYCERCGTANELPASHCWNCLATLPIPFDESFDDRPQRLQFTLSGILTLVSLICICLSVYVESPGLGLVVALVSFPAFFKTVEIASKRREINRPLGFGAKALLFLGSLAFILSAGSLLLVATIGTFFALCGVVISVAMHNFPGEIIVLYLATLLGLGVVVGIAVQIRPYVMYRLFRHPDAAEDGVSKNSDVTTNIIDESGEKPNVVIVATSPSVDDATNVAPASSAEPHSGQLSLASVLLLFTFIAVCLAVTRRNLAAGATLVTLLVPAIVRTAWLTKRRKELGRQTPHDMQSAAFAGSLFTVLLASGMILAASLGTFFLITTGNHRLANLDTAKPIGASLAIAATILSITLIIAWVRWRWRRDLEKK